MAASLNPATLHTIPTAPEFSALTRGIGLRGFYIIMQAGVKGLRIFYRMFFLEVQTYIFKQVILSEFLYCLQIFIYFSVSEGNNEQRLVSG